MLRIVKFRVDPIVDQAKIYAGFMLPDNRHVISIHEGSAFIFPVNPVGVNETFIQNGESHIVAILRFNHPVLDEAVCADIYSRLLKITAYELLTEYYSDEFDGFPVINEKDSDEDIDDLG